MVNERVLKIAETGQIPANDPVSNIMSQVEIKQDDEPGLWGSFKKWAGSKGGRMTLGGLGTALGVGLSGGDFRDALGYGVIGAGNTAKTLYRNEQDAKHWADRAAQRNLYWQNYEADRKLRQMLQDERIKAQKDLAAENYRQSMDALAQQYTLNQMALDAAETRAESRQNKLLDDLGVAPALRPYLTASMSGIDLGGAMENYNRNILLDPNSSPEARAAAQQYFEAQKQFDAMMRPPLNFKDFAAGIKDLASSNATPNSLNKISEASGFDIEFKDKLDDAIGRYNTLKAQGWSEENAREASGLRTIGDELRLKKGEALINRETHATNAGVDYGYEQAGADAQLGRDKEMADYNARIAEEKANQDFLRTMNQIEVEQEYKRQFEFFIRTLPPGAIQEIQWKAEIMGMTPAEYLRPEMEKRTAEALKAQREATAVGKPTFGDLQTGVSNGTVSADRANEMYGGNYFQNKPANSSFNTEQQKQLAKDTDEYRNMVSKLPELKKTVEKLGKLAKKATYTYFGRGLDWASQQLLGDTTEGAIAREEYMAIVNNQILPLLRDTFGAQFTEREGEQLRQTLGNVNATPEQKIAILNSFIAQKKADIASKQRKIASYGDNDPLGIL